MNKKIVIAIIVIILILLAIFLMKGKGATSLEGTNTNTSSENTSSQTSIKELVAKGKPVTCSFSTTDAANNTGGTVYIAGGNMRGDFTISSTVSKSVSSHMVILDGVSYIWSSESNQGMKMKVDADVVAGQQASAQSPISYDGRSNYNCKSWAPDQNMFNVPSEVTFSDMSAMMQGMPGASGGAGTGNTEMKAMMCGSCDKLSGDQKTQCKLAYQCK